MTVDVEVGDFAVEALPDQVGEVADAEQIEHHLWVDPEPLDEI